MATTADRLARYGVAVLGVSPAYGKGLGSALTEAGFQVVDVSDDAAHWVQREPHPIVLVVLANEYAFALAASLREARPDVPLVALLPRTAPSCYRQAILEGFRGVVALDAPLEDIVACVSHAPRDQMLLPREVVLALATGKAMAPENGVVTPHETTWLRALGDGTSVAALAEMARYSEREMYRLLNRLYAKLGVNNRAEALVKATKLGLID